VLIERRTPISREDTGGTLHDRLAALGADALREGLERLARGETIAPRAQSADGVVYAHKLGKSEARLDWNEPASVLARKVRAFDPWPAAEAVLWNERVRIWSAEPIDARTSEPPGTIVATGRDAIDIATGKGLLRILEIQREGGRRIRVRDWQNARRDSGSAS
jgi:methionyl-tRNA formyltransferase